MFSFTPHVLNSEFIYDIPSPAPRLYSQGGSAPGGRYLSSVSRLRGGHGGWCRGLVYRFAAERTEDARDALHNLLLPLKGLLGGKAPYATEGGTS